MGRALDIAVIFSSVCFVLLPIVTMLVKGGELCFGFHVDGIAHIGGSMPDAMMHTQLLSAVADC